MFIQKISSRSLRFVLMTVASLVLSIGAAWAQNVKVSGTVTDGTGEPLIGVYVVVEGTTTGASTDLDGNYTLDAPANANLVFSLMGMQNSVVPVNNRSVINVVMQEDAVLLGDVVVVGYGAQKKENLTGAVASVDVSKALESRPVADIGRGLQGTTPGLTIQVGSAELGSDPRIRIRGQVGSYNGSSEPLILLDNVEIPSLNLINPDDIESISVLKDAASASIYGAKAAFGVILITSKKGSKEADKVTVNYSANFAFQNLIREYDIADVDGLHYTVEAAERIGNTNPTGAFWLIDRKGYNAAVAWKEKYGSTLDANDPLTFGRDWYVVDGTKKIGIRTYDPYEYIASKNAPSMTHNLTVAGNKGKTNFNISLAYMDQDGMIKVSDYDFYERFNTNVRVNTQINKWLNVHTGMMFTRSNKSEAYATSSTGADVWYYLFRWGPTYPLVAKDENGNNVRTAAYEFAAAPQGEKITTYTSVNVGTTITPLKNWDINFDYTYAYNNTQLKRPGFIFTAGDTWVSPVSKLNESGSIYTIENEWADYNLLGGNINAMQLNNYAYQTGYNEVYQDSYTSERQTWNITTTYDWDINEKHMFDFMLGFNAVAYETSGIWANRKDLIDMGKPEFSLATGTQTNGGSHSWESQAGFFGRINYNYNEKYLAEFNLRYDGSSKFPTHLQWRWFPSASIGWRVTQEPWMESVTDVLSSMKIRASWGSIGDQTVAGSLYIPTMANLNTAWQHDLIKDMAYRTPGLVVSDISWQNIQTLDFGVDFSLFHQVNVTFDWFQRDTKDMIVPMEGIGYNVGTSAPSGNYGSLRTRGWEVAVNWGKTFKNGLSLNLTATLADAVTTVTEYGSAKSITGWYNGKTYGEIWGYEVDRLFQHDDFARDEKGNLIAATDKYGSYYQYAAGKDYATQGKISSGDLISGPGDVKFKDLNGDGVIDNGSQLIDNYGDLTVIGNTTPRYEYSFRADANWKGFDLSVFLQGIGQRDQWGSSSMTLPGFNTGDGAMAQAFAGDFWYETIEDGKVVDANYDAFYPRAANCGGSSTFNMVTNDKYLLDLSYLRIKNITLGYTIPAKITNKANINKVRVFVSLENFFTFDKLNGLPIDPEIVPSSSYNAGRAGVGTPAYKTASFGIQIGL